MVRAKRRANLRANFRANFRANLRALRRALRPSIGGGAVLSLSAVAAVGAPGGGLLLREGERLRLPSMLARQLLTLPASTALRGSSHDSEERETLNILAQRSTVPAALVTGGVRACLTLKTPEGVGVLRPTM